VNRALSNHQKERTMPTMTRAETDSATRSEAVQASAPVEVYGEDTASREVRQEAERLGLWSATLHRVGVQRRPMRAKIAEADDRTLADEHLYWVSELGRITEVVGMLNAQEIPAALRVKAARAQVRVTARTTGDGKTPSQAALDDLAEIDPEVRLAEERLGRIRGLLAAAGAAKEATATYVQGLSREITLRGDAKRARMY
jgi:hypothetical protein